MDSNFLLATDKESKIKAMQWRVEWENARMKSEIASVDTKLVITKDGRRSWGVDDAAEYPDVSCNVGLNRRNICDRLPHCEWAGVFFGLGNCVERDWFLADVCEELRTTRRSIPGLPVRGMLMTAVARGEESTIQTAESLILGYQEDLVSYDDMLAAIYMVQHLQLKRLSLPKRLNIQHVLSTFGSMKVPLQLKLDVADELLLQKKKKAASSKRRKSGRRKSGRAAQPSSSWRSKAAALLVGALTLLPTAAASVERPSGIRPGGLQIATRPVAPKENMVDPSAMVTLYKTTDEKYRVALPTGKIGKSVGSLYSALNLLWNSDRRAEAVKGAKDISTRNLELRDVRRIMNSEIQELIEMSGHSQPSVQELEDNHSKIIFRRVKRQLSQWRKFDNKLKGGDFGGSIELRALVAKLLMSQVVSQDPAVYVSKLFAENPKAFQVIKEDIKSGLQTFGARALMYERQTGISLDMEDTAVKTVLGIATGEEGYAVEQVLSLDIGDLEKSIAERVGAIWDYVQELNPEFVDLVSYGVTDRQLSGLLNKLSTDHPSINRTYESIDAVVGTAFLKYIQETPEATPVVKNIVLASMLPFVRENLSNWRDSVATILFQENFSSLLNKQWKVLGGPDRGPDWKDLTTKDVDDLLFMANQEVDNSNIRFLNNMLLWYRNFAGTGNLAAWGAVLGTSAVMVGGGFAILKALFSALGAAWSERRRTAHEDRTFAEQRRHNEEFMQEQRRYHEEQRRQRTAPAPQCCGMKDNGLRCKRTTRKISAFTNKPSCGSHQRGPVHPECQ